MQLDELLSEVRANAQSVPVPMMDRTMRTVVDDFFRRSRAYRHTATDTPAPYVSTYRIRTPDGTTPFLLISCVLDGCTLQITSPRQLDLENPDWRSGNGTPRACWLENGTLHLTPVPDVLSVLGLHTTVALTPARSTDTLDSDVANEHFNTLVAGVLGRLLSMGGVDWSNPALGASFAMAYAEGVDTAILRGDHNDTAKIRVSSYGGY